MVSLAAALAEILQADGPFNRALEIHQIAAQTAQDLNRPTSYADALTDLGRVRRVTGNYPGADDAHARALDIYRTLGDRTNEAWALNHYAASLAASGHRALTLYQKARAMNRELNKPDDEALSLEGIGEQHLHSGATQAGVANLSQALEIFRLLGMAADAERVRNRLANLAVE